jgi:ABC-type transport system involved in cytochrome c biogenesis permease subunit
MDTIVSNEIYYCNSKYRQKILPFIYFYKSLFLIVGGYLAAKTRHVHISALNDSKFIVWSIYTVVLTSIFTFTVMISIQNLRTYVVLCLVVVIMTSFIICLVFVPKVKEDIRYDIFL